MWDFRSDSQRIGGIGGGVGNGLACDSVRKQNQGRLPNFASHYSVLQF